jgi:Zn-dependent peptidase ImmA (M78 family)
LWYNDIVSKEKKMEVMDVAKAKERARNDANDLLLELWDGSTIPINVLEMAKLLGAETWDATIPGTVSGMVRRYDDKIKIYVDKNDVWERKRFTIAHEIGHIIYHNNYDKSGKLQYVDERGVLASAGTDPVEVYCNNFAANLLMPEFAIYKLRPVYDTSELAKALNVSSQAMYLRLKNLDTL